MFYPSDWTHRQFLTVVELLRTGATIGTSAKLVDLEDKHVMDLPTIAAGSVEQFDPGRVSTVTFNDPGRTLANYEGSNATHYMIKLFYSVQTDDPDLGKATWPIACSVNDQPVRDGDQVTFTGRSKVVLAQYNPREPFVVPAGTLRTEAIRRIMAAAGESRALMEWGDGHAVLHEDWVVAPKLPDGDPDTQPHTFMVRARDLATLGFDVLFYRPPGSLILKPPPSAPSVVFTEGNGKGWPLTSQVKTTGSFEDLHNVCTVRYGPNLDKHVSAEPHARHPLSPKNPKFSRRNSERTLERVLDRSDILHQAVAQSLADRTLRRDLREALSHSAECFPFPFLESGDIGRFQTADYTGNSTLTWRLDLTPGAPMTIGWDTFAFMGAI